VSEELESVGSFERSSFVRRDVRRLMHYPAHLDGCSVVLLRQEGRDFRVLESGCFSFDGETLSLVHAESSRPFSDGEQDALMPVAAGNRIGECRGFDFFLLVEAAP
jgi:hypothetical protein